MTTQKNTQPNVADNAPEGLSLSEAEQVKARKDGAKDAVKEAAANSYKFLTDGNLPGEVTGKQYIGADDIMQFEPLLGLGVEAFEKRVSEKGQPPVPEEKVAGLLSLERAGQNRTPYVKAMMKRLQIDHPREVTNAGPDYTNDVSPISAL